MPLKPEFALNVVFVIAMRKKAGVYKKTPVGTAFFVRVSEGGLDFDYAITAAHCVRAEKETWLRFRREGDETEDVEIADWGMHPTEDVALVPVSLEGDDHHHGTLPSSFFDPSEHRMVRLGERVYFIGLLTSIPAMAERSIPMVRSGTLGRLYQDGIPITDKSTNTERHMRGHLIDCRSYTGFSGSPCLVQREQVDAGAQGNGVRVRTFTHLLGLMSAHFPDPEDRWAHAGVGVVTPSEHIWELIMSDEMVTDRKVRTSMVQRDADEEE